MSTAIPCPAIDCCPDTSYSYSITSGRTYTNKEASFIFDCPVGFICAPGQYPRTVIVPCCIIHWQPPPYNGDPQPLTLQGCESLIVENLAGGLTPAQVDAIAEAMLVDWTAQQARCIEAATRRPGSTRKKFNSEQSVFCPTGQSLTNVSATLTKPLKIVGGVLIVKAGYFQGKTQTEADQAALNYGLNFFAVALGNGSFTCGTTPPPPSSVPCSIFEADSTLFGQQTLGNTINSEIQWAGLGIGSYIFVYVDHIFQEWDALFVCQPFWGVDSTPPNWSTTDGSSGALPTQAMNFASEALAIADYLTKTMPSFANLSATNGTIDAEIDINGINVFCSTGPDMVFDLMRTQKLIAPQPISMTIASIATYASSRFILSSTSVNTSGLALNAGAATVEAALNAISPISLAGGVVCAGTLLAGMTITWNVNGSRALVTGNVVTVSPGWVVRVLRTQAGNAGQPEIQTLTVTPICDEFVQDNALPDYNGTIPNRLLSGVGAPQWYFTAATFPNAPTYQIAGIQYQNTRSSLQCGPDAPLAAPTLANGGAGNVDAGTHLWMVTFTSNLVTFNNTDSGPGLSALLTLGVPSNVNLTNIPLGPAGTTARNIYRTRAGDGNFRLVGTIADNTTTVFNDNVADNSIFYPPNPASRWWALNISCVFDGPPKLELDIWEGYKLTGNDPTGIYTVRANYFDGSGTCRQVAGAVQQIQLTGVF